MPRLSDQIKHELLYYLLIQGNYRLAVTEALNGADVLAVNGKWLTTEYEIKTSRADLKGEMDVMTYVIDEARYRAEMAKTEPDATNIFGPDYPHGQELLYRRAKLKGSYNKQDKHNRNLVEAGKKYPRFHPNYFYFVVPAELAGYADERLTRENSPYGLLVKDDRPVMPPPYYCRRRPKRLHDEPLPEVELHKMMRRACLENMTLKQRLTETLSNANVMELAGGSDVKPAN